MFERATLGERIYAHMFKYRVAIFQTTMWSIFKYLTPARETRERRTVAVIKIRILRVITILVRDGFFGFQ